MYVCKRCNEEFKEPYVASVDAGGLHDIAVMRRHKAPMICLCPNCGSNSIKKEELAKVG